MISPHRIKNILNKRLRRFLFCVLMVSFSSTLSAQNTYPLTYILSNRDTLADGGALGLQSKFKQKADASVYIFQIIPSLAAKGFAGASVDSVVWKEDKGYVYLFTGSPIYWEHLQIDSVEKQILDQIHWSPRELTGMPVRFSDIEKWKNNLLNYYLNNGYPFAKIEWKNVELKKQHLSANWLVNKGVFYRLDSIRVYGSAKISNLFLQKYLSLKNGSPFNQQKINEVSKQIGDLAFLQEISPATVTMLGTGATLNLYLAPKRSSVIDVLVGFVPADNPQDKSRLIADVNLDLNNAFSMGENILFNWQQLQPESPRLRLGYVHPFIFGSNAAFDGQFQLYKQDSSYLHISAFLGAKYFLSAYQTLGFFYNIENSYLLSGALDTNQIKVSKELPRFMDVTTNSFGLSYDYNSLDYAFNPRKGLQFQLVGALGVRNVKMNDDILNLKDPSNPSFSFRSLYDSIQLKSYKFSSTLFAANYFSIGKNSVFKTAVGAGFMESPQLYENELFGIGGYRILRGFDEESIYANLYGGLTLEYRYLLGTNSYFSIFSDGALTSAKIGKDKFSNSFISGGIGLEFETKLGLLNISYAVGKRNDVPFDFKSASKIHFGYINYF